VRDGRVRASRAMFDGRAEKAAHEHAIAGAPGLFFAFDAVFFEDLFDIGADVVVDPFVQIADDVVHLFIGMAAVVIAGLAQKAGFLVEFRVVEVFIRPAAAFGPEKRVQQMRFARIARAPFAFIAVGISKSARTFAGAHPFRARAEPFTGLFAGFFRFDATDVRLRKNPFRGSSDEYVVFGASIMRPNGRRPVVVFRDEVSFPAVDAITTDMRHFGRTCGGRSRIDFGSGEHVRVEFGVESGIERRIERCIDSSVGIELGGG